MKRQRSSERGFTLIEIVVTMAVLLVGLSSLLALFPVGLKAGDRASNLSTVGMLAQLKMAEVAYLGYGSDLDKMSDGNMQSWDIGNTYFTQTTPDGVPKAFGDMFECIAALQATDDHIERYSWVLYVHDLDTSVDNLVQASLYIYWNDEGRQRVEFFTTYLATYE